MSSRSPKDLIKSKWGPKPGNTKSETALEKLKGAVDELTSGKGKFTEKERHKLLEKIQVLQAEREKNVYQLAEKEKEIQRLRDQLKSRCSTSALLEQLEDKMKEGDRMEQLLKSLSEETDSLKKQLSATMERLGEFESQANALHLSQTVAASSPRNNAPELEIQLKDALEKNQQWLVYDQQREAFVKGLLAKIFELERKTEASAPSPPQSTKKAESEGDLQKEKEKYYSQLLANAQRDLDTERQTINHLTLELTEFQKKYEEAQKEVQDLNQLLCSQREAEAQHLEDDRCKTERIERLKEQNNIARKELEEERKRSEELLSQVQLLYTSLVKQQEEQTRVALLEQQMQSCALDFENEKLDRQHMQHQLQVILKELRKARNQITQLESLKALHEFPFSEPLATFQAETANKEKATSPKGPSTSLDDSVVECPKCSVQYPATEHRDLLVHVEYCSQ